MKKARTTVEEAYKITIMNTRDDVISKDQWLTVLTIMAGILPGGSEEQERGINQEINDKVVVEI